MPTAFRIQHASYTQHSKRPQRKVRAVNRLYSLSLLALISGSVAAADTPAPKITVTASSHQGGNEPDRAVDGKVGSFWHSRWGEPKATLPQSLIIDQGAITTVACLSYLPRPEGGNGTVTAYNIAVSSDSSTYTTVVENGRWAANAKRKSVTFTPTEARYIRFEVLDGVGGFASADEIGLTPVPVDPAYEYRKVAVVSPAYCGDISGTTTIDIIAPGLTSVEVTCWKQGEGFGSLATVGNVALDANSKGSISFPADDFPHGPICVQITGTDGTNSDTCCLQLYNRGGTSWKEGLPKAPPAAEGMTLIFADDFAVMPTISSTDLSATYYDHKPPNGSQDFSSLRFTGFEDAANPFAHVDTYLRIRADEATNSAGIISSMKNDASGITASAPCYFECRMMGSNATGAWPAFWLLSDYMTEWVKTKRLDNPCDEIDIIEAYGGEGKKSPNAFDKFCVTPHAWNQPDQTLKKAAMQEIYAGKGSAQMDWAPQVVAMKNIGIPSNWYQAMHIYAVKITEENTIYYCDDIEIARHTTLEVSKKAPFFFLINLATGGGWPVDLSRYNGLADMYVDYVRVYSANPKDIERVATGK